MGQDGLPNFPLSSLGAQRGVERQHHLCLLGVPIVGRNQPSKEWMW